MLAEWMNILWLRSKALLHPEEAHYAARRQFGNAAEVKEANRDLWGFALLETVWQDLCYGLRQSRRNPGFTATAVLTLALGIGATTGIFAVFNAVLLQSLPYPDSGRIVEISRRTCDSCGTSASIPWFIYWEENNPGFENLTAYQSGASVNLSGGDKPELVDAIEASKNYFRLFGAKKADVLALIIRQGMTPALLGLGVGTIGAVGLTRFLSSLLYGVKPTDPLTFVSVSLILTSVALLACYIPARRAAKVDPMVALRQE